MNYLAVVLLFLGVFYVNKLQYRGHILGGLSNTIWLVLSLNDKNYALALQSSILLLMAVYGTINWKVKGIKL